ncbi:MAG: hypothetical protein ABFD54_18075 [Armatimonadota bacterium]|nr:hypothetical protein [bacterium]
MYRKKTMMALVVVMLIFIAACGVYAADWQWPDKMSIAGFNVTGIRGSVRPDGSGSASGSLAIQGMGSQNVSLTRSASGDVTGSVSLNGSASGTDVQGNFTLNSRGLEGRGSIQCSPKPITDASMSVNSNGRVSGNGRVSLGSLAIPAEFAISGGSFDVNGTASVQKQQDTPLAVYAFNGTLKLQGSSSRIAVVANGEVKRTGKLANQVSSTTVSNLQVNASDGQATVNVGGVSVTFKFF